MRCDVCGSSDNVFFIRPDVLGTDLHLCKACAIARGYADARAGDGLGARFDSMLGADSVEEPALVCPTCGMTAEKLRSSGRLGCTDCAGTFKREILSILRKSGRTGTYEGKVPACSGKEPALEETVRALSCKLEAAIHADDFESAAQIRDKLRAIPGTGTA